MPTWDADLYLRYADQRTRPAADLVARIAVDRPRRIIDLGCGPGNSTEVLRQRWPEAEVIGLDHSPDMIAAARRRCPEGRWVLADLASWTDGGPYDVVFSNAALQWLPDHRSVFPRLFERVGPNGALAVQMPSHLQSSLHQLMLEVSRRPEWDGRMTAARTALLVNDAAFYYDLLQPLAGHIDLWETEYHHVMDNAGAIVEWIRGTGLRPFLQALADEKERGRFEELLLRGVEGAYPQRADGRILFPFRRLFLVAYHRATVTYQ